MSSCPGSPQEHHDASEGKPDATLEAALEDLIAECAERLDHEGVAALAAMCAAHPGHAAALRQAIEPLLAFGIVGPSASDAAGTPARLGEFELVREIGRGGMGVVYEARQPSLGRTVALKLLPTGWVQDPRQISRFQNEARAAATLDHPHIVPVFVFGEHDGTHYYAMQLIAGTSVRRLLATMRGTGPADSATAAVLASLCPAGGSSDPEPQSATRFEGWTSRAAELARQAATALDKTHSLGILHRDIKPGNLLVDANSHLWVTDFGLAHFVREASDLTRSGEFVGTVAYCSPEQLGGSGLVDARSDVYSLGATLYEMLCLRAPFVADDPAVLMRKVLHDEPVPLRAIDQRIPRDLETIVHKAIAKEPANRYQTAGALAVDLQAFVDGRTIAARPVTRMQRGLRWCRRNRVLAAALLGILALAILATGISYAALRVAEERDRAVSAERHVTQLSARRQIETIRRTVEVDRRAPTPGSRFDSLTMLQKLVAEVDTAAATALERQELLCQLRSDAFSVLDIWDATAEPLVGNELARPMAFDPTYRLCAAERDGALVVAELNGRELARLGELENESEVDFGPKGDWLAVAAGTAVRLWEWRAGRVVHLRAWSVAGCICWSADGREAFALRQDPLRIEACELQTGTTRVICTPAKPSRPAANVWGLSVSPDGRRFAACFAQLPELWIFEAGQAGPPRQIALPFPARCSSWEADAEHLVVGGRPGLIRLHCTSGVMTGAAAGAQQNGESTLSLVASAGGDVLASRDLNRQVSLWNRRGVRLLTIENATDTRHIGFAADGEHLGWQAVHDARGAPAGAVYWRLHPPVELREFPTGSPPAAAPVVAFHPSLPLLAVMVADAIVFLDAHTGASLGKLPWPWVNSLAFLPDGTLFVSHRGKASGCSLVAVDAGHLPEVRIGKARRIESIAKARSAGSQSGFISTWDGTRARVFSPSGTELGSVEPTGDSQPTAVSLLAAGKYAVFSTAQGASGSVWNVATGRVELSVPAFQRGIEFVPSPDGRMLAVLRNDQHWLLEVGTWKRLAVIPRRRIEPSVGSGAFSQDGTLLVATTTRSRLQLVGTKDFQPLVEWEMPGEETVTEPCFGPDGMTLAIPSRTRPSVYVWNLRAVRGALRGLGLDWSEAPIPAAAQHQPLRLVFE